MLMYSLHSKLLFTVDFLNAHLTIRLIKKIYVSTIHFVITYFIIKGTLSTTHTSIYSYNFFNKLNGQICI